MQMKLKRITVCLALAFAPSAFAAEPPTLPEVEVTAEKLQPLPAPNSTGLDKNNLRHLRSVTSDSASLMRDVPGVSLNGAGGVSSLPSIHGLADDRLRVKVDGMDLIASCPNHMNPPMSYIDPSNVGALKVYAGLSPVSTGGDSIGGTVLVSSQAPVFAAAGEGQLLKGEVGAFLRSNNSAKGANLSATIASESLSLSYNGSVSEANNYKAGGAFKASGVTGRVGHVLALDEVGSTAYATSNHALGLAMKGDGHLVEAKIGLQSLPNQLYPNQRMDMLDNQQTSLNLRYLGDMAWGNLEARVYHENVDHMMDFGADKRYWYGMASGGLVGIAGSGVACGPIGPTCATGMPMYTASKNTGATLKADIALNQKDILRVGGEYQHYTLNDWWTPSGGGMWPNTFWNINGGKRDRTALFGEWESHVNPAWMTMLGVRFERVNTDSGNVHGYNQATFPTVATPVLMHNQIRDAANFNNSVRAKTDNNWDLNASGRYTASINNDIEFGFAHKTRSPNLYERYTWSTWQMAALMNNFVGDGNGYLGDVNLKPEQANTLSATFDWHASDREWGFKATPYYTQVADYIDAVQWNSATNSPTAPLLANQFTVLKYVNQSARLYGLDLSGHMLLASNGWGEFGVKGLLNYTHGKNRTTGDDLYNIMPLNAKVTLTQKIGSWDNGLELVMVDSKKNISDARNEIKTGGYNLVNLRSSYTWKQIRVDFGVENLFDKLYALPLGGAYVGQGMTMTTALVPTGSVPLWGTAVPGMGRSINLGMTVKF
ncbi:MAG: TonB-dependent receptor [Gallionellales bacterium CG_4_8_14_3_um_filter_54_18]|nr:MAG: TonB-dependent receptor [Gallionellales bacterium CG_4_8_14_3_um_filter_54_18]